MNANAIIRASAPFFQKYVLSPEMPAKRHLAMMLLGLCFTAPLLANEVLRIESQAAKYSAQIYIQEEEKGSVPEKEKENDQKRKKLGIGETVILTLVSDKPQLIGDPSQIEWTIEEGENLAFFEDRDKSETTTLIIRKDISAGGPITIKATTEEGLGFTGTGEGISSQAICSLMPITAYIDEDIAATRRSCEGCGGCQRK